MAYLNPNLPFLASVQQPEFFVSPFPSTFDSDRLRSLGALSAGNIAKAGASAWSTATQIALKAKAVHVGDLRTDWLSKIVRDDPETGMFKGAFASVAWPDSIDMGSLEQAMITTGFNLSEGILTSVPVYGQILGAVIGVAQWFHDLFQRAPKVQQVLVPWKAYDKGLDEDLCKLVVFPAMQEVDWSRLFWPALHWQEGFRMFVTEEGSDTRAWGTFTEAGVLRYATSAPGSSSGAGLGFMPGTQRMADVVQLAIYGLKKGPSTRIDAITSVGDFFPATTQACTALWEMVQKAGNPDMYKVRAGQIHDAWDAYFDAMRQSFAEQWNQRWAKGYTDGGVEELVNLGKLVSPFMLLNGDQSVNLDGLNARYVWPGMSRKDGAWQGDPNDGRPRCPSKPHQNPDGGWLSDLQYQAGAIYPPDRCSMNVSSSVRNGVWRFLDGAAIKPATRRLKEAQHRALYRTEVCAYVRPNEVGGLARYGAFNDTSAPIGSFNGTFGEQLRERCLFAREKLLSNDLRFKVRLEDVDAIDPPYAAKLRDAGVTEDSWKQGATTRYATPIGESAEVPPAEGPVGGWPFEVRNPERKGTASGAGLLLVGAAAVTAIGLAARK